MRQHRDAGVAGFAVAGAEHAAEQRLDPQQLEESGRDARPAERLGSAGPGDDRIGWLQPCQLPAGRLARVLPRVDRSGVDREYREPVRELGDDELHHHQPVGLPVGKRREQDAVDERVDRGRGTDAETQRRHRHRREERFAPQRPHGQSDVPNRVRHWPHAACVPHRLPDRGHPAEPQVRPAARLAGVHAGGAVLLRLHLQVETELLFRLGVLASPAHEAPESSQ